MRSKLSDKHACTLRNSLGNLFTQVVEEEKGNNEDFRVTCSSIIHSASWLMKCIALELFNSLKANQTSSCARLLHLLFASKEVKGHTSSTALSILSSLTLRSPGGGKPKGPPPTKAAKAVAASVVKLSGAQEVFGNYCVVDGSKVVRELGEIGNEKNDPSVPKPTDSRSSTFLAIASPSESENDGKDFSLTSQTLDWAKEWNRYVLAACSSAHVCKAWSLLIGTAIVSCTELLVKDRGNDGMTPGVIDLNDLSNMLKAVLERLVGDSTVALEGGSALPLCDAVLRIVGVLKLCNAEIDEALLSLLGKAVCVVGKGEAGEELSGLLSCALCLSIGISKAGLSDGIRQDVSTNLVQAADFLSDVGGGTSINGKLARSGFCSILGLTGEDTYSIDALHRDMSRQRLKSMVNVCVGDADGVWTLVKIACSQIGAKNLMDCGVGAELIAKCGLAEEIGEESSFVGAAWENQGRQTGSLGNKGGSDLLFYGQLKLFGTMLCSLPKSGLVGSECCRFLRMKCVSGVEMLKQFPQDIGLVGTYVEVLEALACGGGWNSSTMGKVGGKIEQGVLSLGLHLCNFPLRRGLEEGRTDIGPSWWDAVGFDAMSDEEKGAKLGGIFSLGGWFERDYEYVDAALKISSCCLGFIRSVMTTGEELVIVDGSLLSRGLEVCVG